MKSLFEYKNKLLLAKKEGDSDAMVAQGECERKIEQDVCCVDEEEDNVRYFTAATATATTVFQKRIRRRSCCSWQRRCDFVSSSDMPKQPQLLTRSPKKMSKAKLTTTITMSSENY